MNRLYPAALDALLSGEVDVLGDAVKLAIFGGDAYFDAADEFVADFPGTPVVEAVAFTTKTVTAGTFHADPVTFASVPAGSSVYSALVYVDSGDPATSRLLTYIDRRADTVGLQIETNGGPITFTFPDGIVFRLVGGAT